MIYIVGSDPTSLSFRKIGCPNNFNRKTIRETTHINRSMKVVTNYNYSIGKTMILKTNLEHDW